MTKKFVLLVCTFALLFSGKLLLAKTLVGASQFDANHAYSKMMQRFADEAMACDAGLKFKMSLSSQLGLEKDYLNFMARGNAVDFGVVSPGHMANYSNAITIMSMPFLFRDIDHWQAALNSDAFDQVAKEFEKKSDVIILGYTGGTIRNIIANRKVASADDIKGLKIRVQGAPIHAKIWSAVGAQPSVISYNEVYNAIQTGVVESLENGSDSFTTKKFHEVAPHFGLTRHTITIRPLLFSGKTFRTLNSKQQACIRQAGKSAVLYGRQLELDANEAGLQKFASKGLVTAYEIENHDQLLKKAEKVKRDFAKSVGAESVLKAVNSK